MKNTNLRTIAGIATAVTLTVALTGCSNLNSLLNATQDAQREPGGQITEAADADVFSLQVGDCFDYEALSSSTDIESVPTVPCSDPHDGEIYAEADLTDDQFAQGDAFYDEFCLNEFTTFIGKPYDESTLDRSYFYPSPQSWAMGDKKLQCIVLHPDNTFTGSMKGSQL